MSPAKVRVAAAVVRRRPVREALAQLDAMGRAAAIPLAKLIRSAVANARHDLGLAEDNLYVASLQVNEGPTMKRWMPRSHGQANKILKRTSGVLLMLSEIEEGKGRTAPLRESIAKRSAEEKAADRKATHAHEEHDHGAAKAKAKAASGVTQRFFRRKAA